MLISLKNADYLQKKLYLCITNQTILTTYPLTNYPPEHLLSANDTETGTYRKAASKREQSEACFDFAEPME